MFGPVGKIDDAVRLAVMISGKNLLGAIQLGN
jgi:hypothetical protein